MRRALVFFIGILSTAAAGAAVTITSITGSIVAGGTVTISGSGFGSKSPAAPMIWAPFDNNSNPSSLGRITSWSEVTGMTWTGTEGFSGGGMKSSDSTGDWTMRVDRSNWTDEGQKGYWSAKKKMNFIISSANPGDPPPVDTRSNWKIWRMWPTPSNGNYPNVYAASSNGRIYVENIGTESGFWSSAIRWTTTNWVREEQIFQASSAAGVKDGTWTYRLDGQQMASGTLITRSAAAPAYMTENYVVHFVQANKSSWTNPPWSDSNAAWVDEVYVDDSWSRCMLADASTYAAVRRFNMMIPTAWASGSISAVVGSTSDVTPGATAYMYCFDSNNNVNGNGFAVTVGGSSSGPTIKITSISPSTGSYLGGDVILMTGTAFQPGLTVLVGTSTATGVTWLASTAVQFTTPAGPASTTVDITATNPDSTFDVLAATFTYSAAPAPPYYRDPDLRLIGKIRLGAIKNH